MDGAKWRVLKKSLKVLADIKAKKLESTVAARRVHEWRVRLGALPSSPGGPRVPTT